jgi:hypothetical protein
MINPQEQSMDDLNLNSELGNLTRLQNTLGADHEKVQDAIADLVISHGVDGKFLADRGFLVSDDLLTWNGEDALLKQHGGSHYKSLHIQPVEYVHYNKLGFIEGNVIKYVTRHRAKGGADDIRKAIHFLELLLKLEYDAE